MTSRALLPPFMARRMSTKSNIRHMVMALSVS